MQPKPIRNGSMPIWELVIQDMRERDELGLSKYGTRLQAGNGRDALMDAYQEALDLCVYLRQAIEERRRSQQEVQLAELVLSIQACAQGASGGFKKDLLVQANEHLARAGECLQEIRECERVAEGLVRGLEEKYGVGSL